MLAELMRRARVYDRGPAAFMFYSEFRDRLELLSGMAERDDAALMLACARARHNTFPVDMPPLDMIAMQADARGRYRVGILNCGGAIMLPGPPQE